MSLQIINLNRSIQIIAIIKYLDERFSTALKYTIRPQLFLLYVKHVRRVLSEFVKYVSKTETTINNFAWHTAHGYDIIEYDKPLLVLQVFDCSTHTHFNGKEAKNFNSREEGTVQGKVYMSFKNEKFSRIVQCIGGV